MTFLEKLKQAEQDSRRKIILEQTQSPGDILSFTRSVIDFKLSFPEWEIDVRTPCPEIWENCPYLTPLNKKDPGVEIFEIGYPDINISGWNGLHYTDAFRNDIENQLKIKIKKTSFKPELWISDIEKTWINHAEVASGWKGPFWLLNAGCKSDNELKQYHRYQEVVDLLNDFFEDKTKIIQIGHKNHNHPSLNGVLNLVGKTDLRQLIRLAYWSEGLIGPLSFQFVLGAALEKPGVVIAGGKEGVNWHMYPNIRYLYTNGTIDCCSFDGCWLGGKKGECKNLVDNIPKCFTLIKPYMVADAVKMYYEGGMLSIPTHIIPLKEKDKVMHNFSINMIASKPKYHIVAACSSATYRKFLPGIEINVFVPKEEEISDEFHKIFAKQRINIKRFDFNHNKKLKYVTQLKSQGFINIIENLSENQFALIVDSDTYCIREFDIPQKTQDELKNGKIILTKEPWNRYESLHGDSNRPDYIPTEKRLIYINSGVIAASKNTLDIFQKIKELSEQPGFSLGPLHDQTIINYCTCMYFEDRVAYLDKAYNGICTTDPDTTIIGHNGQGIGVGKGRSSRHYNICYSILNDEKWFHHLQKKKTSSLKKKQLYKHCDLKYFMETNLYTRKMGNDFLNCNAIVHELSIGRKQIPSLVFEQLSFTKGAEIGVKFAGFANYIIKALSCINVIYLVDPWRHYQDEIYKDGANVEQDEQNKRYEAVKAKYQHMDNIKIIREESAIASTMIAKDSLDFVYIDANHTFPFVLEDLTVWYEKVKPGGIISGHDVIGKSSVDSALKKFIKDKKIKHLYITNDHPWRSYIFQKEYKK